MLFRSLLGAQKQVAYNETATNAYHVLDFAVSFGFGKTENLTVKSGIKNILNTNYIDHLSRLKNIQMPFPGRNFYLSINYCLNQNLKSKSA